MAICARWWNCVAEMQGWVAVEQLFGATVALWAQPSRHGPWAEAYGKSSAIAHLDLAARLTVSQTHSKAHILRTHGHFTRHLRRCVALRSGRTHRGTSSRASNELVQK